MIKKKSNNFKKLALTFTILALMLFIATHGARAAETINSNYGGMMENWDWGDMMGNGWNGTGWSGGLFFVMGGLMMILFWVVLVLAAIALLKWLIDSLQGKPGSSGNKAMEILKEKYAKGEITKDEFEAKKKDLM